jgi:hypothetical protein
VFKKKKDKPADTSALAEMLREAAQGRVLQQAQLEFDRQTQMQQMANLTTYHTGTIPSGTTYTTSGTGTFTVPSWGTNVFAGTATSVNWVYVDPDKYVSHNDAANRVMQLRDQFGWNDLKPSIRGKRFNHYGLEWRMI